MPTTKRQMVSLHAHLHACSKHAQQSWLACRVCMLAVGMAVGIRLVAAARATAQVQAGGGVRGGYKWPPQLTLYGTRSMAHNV